MAYVKLFPQRDKLVAIHASAAQIELAGFGFLPAQTLFTAPIACD
jgi:hypothetical protein